MENHGNSKNLIDQLTIELGTEKAATQKLESSKLVLERQNKELKAKFAELETSGRAKTKASPVLKCSFIDINGSLNERNENGAKNESAGWLDHLAKVIEDPKLLATKL